MTEDATLLLVGGVVRLETGLGQLVGWARLPGLNKTPDVLIWGDRMFRNQGAFIRGPAAEADDPQYVLYREAFAWALPVDQLEKERPGAAVK